MLTLLRVPLDLLRIGFYAVLGVLDSLRGRNRLRVEYSVVIKAPRDLVWKLCTADRVVYEGPPLIEIVREPLPDSDGLHVVRVSHNGQLQARAVSRRIERDDAKGVALSLSVPHQLTFPPESANECLYGTRVEARPDGTELSIMNELTVRSFRERIVHPVAIAQRARQIKRQCEKESGRQSRVNAVADHWLVLSGLALASFWYLVGWQSALLLGAAVALHELGHALAMRLVGIEVHGVYLVPFFGGAAVPKTSYRSEGNLAFVALMGPTFSLVPTFALVAAQAASGGGGHFLEAAWLFALLNVSNLLPIYPLDGGLILNALLGSFSRRLALIIAWTGVLAGLAFAIYWQSVLIGIPFFLFAIYRYLGGGRGLALKPLKAAGAAAVVLAYLVTVALYFVVLMGRVATS